MANVVYEIKFTLTDAESIQSNQNLSTKVESNHEKIQDKILEVKEQAEQRQIENSKKLVGAVASAVGLAGKGYQNYLYVRNLVNTQRAANMLIQGDVISAQNLAYETNRKDKIVGMIDGTLSPGITAALSTYVSTGNPYAAAGAGALGLFQGLMGTVRSLIAEVNTVNAQARIFASEQNIQSYLNGIVRDKLVKNTGYYR